MIREDECRYNVCEFGASGDMKTDDSEAFFSAVKVADWSGGLMSVPAGKYVIQLIAITYDEAQELNIEGRSEMDKQELTEAVETEP